MAILDPIKPQILSVRIIPNVDRGLAHQLKLRDDQRSLGLITCTIDDALYVSIDEGTKMADVEVVYAKSFYAGAAHASGPLSGEIIAIFAGPDPAEVRRGPDRNAGPMLKTKPGFTPPMKQGPMRFSPTRSPAPAPICPQLAGVPMGSALSLSDRLPPGGDIRS